MKYYTTATYYVANVPLDTIADVLDAHDIPATLTPCTGTSREWGREPTVAVMAVSDSVGQVREAVALILTQAGEECALVVNSNGFVWMLNKDGSYYEPM